MHICDPKVTHTVHPLGMGRYIYSLNLPLYKYVYSTNQTIDTKSLNYSVICIDDDILYIRIFLTYPSSRFYFRFNHEHVFGSTRV